MIADPLDIDGQRWLTSASLSRQRTILRIAIPGIAIFALILIPVLGLPFVPAGLILAALMLGTLSVTAILSERLPSRASVILVCGLGLAIALLCWFSGPVEGHLTLRTLTCMYLFPIVLVLAAFLLQSRAVLLTAGLILTYCIGLFLLIPFADQVLTISQNSENTIILLLPLLVQTGTGFLAYGGNFAFFRLQEALAKARSAYIYEKTVEEQHEQFIASASHELRNPVMAVQNYFVLAEAFHRQGNSSEEQRMLVQGIEVSNRLMKTVQSVLDIRRLKQAKEVVHLTPIDLLPTIQQIVQTFIILNVALPHPVLLAIDSQMRVQADDTLFREVVNNLLSNAAKYSPPNTKITISAAYRKDQGHATPNKLDLTISDEGNGIPKEQQQLVFEPFVRLARDEESFQHGSGLGLAICRSHMRAMQGDIWIESDGIPGRGTHVHLIFPISVAG